MPGDHRGALHRSAIGATGRSATGQDAGADPALPARSDRAWREPGGLGRIAASTRYADQAHLTLDDPERVSRLAVLNAVPTADQFDRMGARPSLGYWPWFFLAQPAAFPERLIAAEPEQFLRHIFESWTSNPDGVGDDAFEVYLQARTEAVITAMCADYRASFHFDRHHNAENRAAGRRIASPVLAITGAEETQLTDAASVWSAWAENVTGLQLPGRHFVPEEASAQLAERTAKG